MMKYAFTIVLYSILIVYSLAETWQVNGDASSICIKLSKHIHGRIEQVVSWSVSTNTLRCQPHWDGVQFPRPLSQSNAVLIALAEVKLHYPNISSWKIENILVWNLGWDKQLKYLGMCSNVWYYSISIAPEDETKGIELTDTGQDVYLDQIILMDGTLVKPSIGPMAHSHMWLPEINLRSKNGNHAGNF